MVAKNFFGDVATQLAGLGMKVASVLSNPDQDPHLFEDSPSMACSLSKASLIF